MPLHDTDLAVLEPLVRVFVSLFGSVRGGELELDHFCEALDSCGNVHDPRIAVLAVLYSTAGRALICSSADPLSIT